MSAFILRRLLLAIPTLFGVLVVVFLLLYVAPGDPVQAMVGERADSATIARLRARAPSRRSAPVRFGHYVGGVAARRPRQLVHHGSADHAGHPRAVPEDAAARRRGDAARDVIGVTLGVLSARNPGGFADRFALGVAYLGISFPVYWVGLLLILLFAVTLRWLPPSGYGGLRYLVLPALALGMRSIAFLARMTRSAMLEVLGGDFVRTARAKGLASGSSRASTRCATR